MGTDHDQDGADMTSLVTYSVRPATSDDMRFVFDSWLKSYRYQADGGGGQAVAGMRDEDYYDLQRGRIEAILRRSGEIRIAHPEGAPSVIAAWACLDREPDVFHYVYTRASTDRRRGLAKQLIGTRRVCTHLTDTRRPDSFAAWKERIGFRYMPHLLDAR